MKINIPLLLKKAEKATKSSKYEEARDYYQVILDNFPKNLQAKRGILRVNEISKINKNNLSIEQINSVMSLYNKGKFHDAILEIKSLDLDYPNVPLLYNILGACYKSLGELDEALRMFDTAAKIKPDYSEAYFNQGVVLKSLGHLKEAVKKYLKAISYQPNYPDAHNNLANIYKDLEMNEEAIKSFEWAIAYKPSNPLFHLNLGILYSSFNEELAINSYKKAIELNPNYAEAYFNMASVLRQLGKKNESIKCYQKAININPEYVDAHKNLSAMKVYKNNDSQIKQMESILLKSDLSQQDRISINFAMAKVCEDLGNSKDFFKFLDKGNSLRKQELRYSFDLDKELIAKIKEVFSSESFKIDNSLLEPSQLRPIFILGMPRSGTTLVEQIISSHSKVFGAGELEYISKYSFEELKLHYRSERSKFSNESFNSIRQNYLNSILKLNLSEYIFTDKMPLNFRCIGFILNAFPEAKIVHLNRDAIATCWSIYKYYFKSDGNGYSYNINDLISYYALYKDLMEYWHKLYPNRIYDIYYEKLTTNQESETRKLLKYCDLEWDENCMNFHKNQRAVKTTSALQVREKMYQGSSEAWKKYESYLKPLINGLKSF